MAKYIFFVKDLLDIVDLTKSHQNASYFDVFFLFLVSYMALTLNAGPYSYGVLTFRGTSNPYLT